MTWSLYDSQGRRKYLVPAERAEFFHAAITRHDPTGAFCAILAICGPRISEALAVTPARIDDGCEAINFETLKRRQARHHQSGACPKRISRFSRRCSRLSSRTSVRAQEHRSTLPLVQNNRLESGTRGDARARTSRDFCGSQRRFVTRSESTHPASGSHQG